MKKRHGVVAAAFVAVTATIAFSVPLTSQTPDLTPSQMRVVWSTDPAHRAVVSWSTAGEGAEHTVHYDTQSRGAVLAEYGFTSEVVITGEYKPGDDSPWFHHAEIADLPADTDIFFVVESDGNVSQELHFRTATDDPTKTIKFLYGGDSRTGRNDRQKMNRLIATLVEEDPEISALVHGGDYIAFANSLDQWTAWMTDHELTIGSDGRVLPIVPAKGNHEGKGEIYNRVFGEPSGDVERNWFFTRFGSLALINLDTEASVAGEQRDWLRERLVEGRQAPWLIVNYHRPAFPAAKSASGAREHWVPLFEEFDVDLVCESDGHTLKRTPPIRDERVDFTGVVYVGEGGLGVPQRTPKIDEHWYLQSPGMASRGDHIQKVEVTEDLLRYQAIWDDGTVADELTIQPREDRHAHRITAHSAAAPSATHIEVQFTRPYDPVSAVEAKWEVEDGIEVASVEIGPQVTAVLALVNSATQDELDDEIGLDSRAARNIVKFRAGDDETLNTDDDRQIETWAELDAISFVGKTALRRLSDAALNGATNEQNIVTLLLADELEEGEMYRVLVPEIEDRDGRKVAAGTTVPVVYTKPDDRADAIAAGAELEEPSAGGCSTARGNSGATASLLVLLFVGLRRRKRAC